MSKLYQINVRVTDDEPAEFVSVEIAHNKLDPIPAGDIMTLAEILRVHGVTKTGWVEVYPDETVHAEE